MKTAIIKSLMLVFIIIGLVHYALYLKTGRLPWGDGSPSVLSLPSLPKSLPKLDNITSGGKTQLYKWVDENGVIHYSQEPPPEHLQSQSIELDPENLNLIPGVVVPASESETQASVAAAPSMDDGKTPVEKAQQARELLETRDREQKKILDSL